VRELAIISSILFIALGPIPGLITQIASADYSYPPANDTPPPNDALL